MLLEPEQIEAMMKEDAQKFFLVLNGLLDGTKRLVIESRPIVESQRPLYHNKTIEEEVGYKHTFHVEDADGK